MPVDISVDMVCRYNICMPSGIPRGQKTVRFPETRVIDDRELLCGYGESNTGPLEK